MKKISTLFKFFSLKPATMFALVASAILALVLASCAPIPESERLPPLQPGYGRIIINTGGVGSRAVTDADKKGARLDVSFNGVSYGHTLHATFKVGTDVHIVVKAYRNDASNEFIGYGTASHTMTYGTNQVTVPMNKVDGYYKVTYEYGDALLGGTYRGITADKNYYKGGEDEVTTPSDDDVTWQHGTLSGWKYNDGSSDQTVGASDDWTFPMPSADTTLTAQWTRNKYDFTYEDNIPSEATQGASVSGKPTDQSQQDALSEITVGTEIPTLTASNQQWTFRHWTLTQADSGTRYSAGDEITLTGDTKLYAQWTDEKVWRVTFAEPTAKPTAYTTNMPQGNIVQQGKAFTWTANPAARGWSFDGWDVTGSTTISSPLSATTTQVTPDADITLTARWTPIEYTVKFNSGNGSAVNDINNFTVNGSDSFAANPTYTGYTFGGWQYNNTPIADAAALRTAITNGSVTASGNNEITLAAQWTVNKYKVKYEPNAPSGATVMYNGATATTQEVERTYGASFSWASNMFTAPNGYSFASWNTQANGNGTTLTGTATSDYINRTDEITVYAKWTEKDYTITYAGGAGSSGSQTGQTISVASKGDELPIKDTTTLSKTGYTLAGWEYNNARYDDLAALRAAISDGTITVTSITLTAVWQVELKSVPEVGDIIMKDGSLEKSTNQNINTADAIAVVYKVEGGKAWAVGKVHAQQKVWCLGIVSGYDEFITSLQCAPDDLKAGAGNYTWTGKNTDGSDNWQKLKEHLNTNTQKTDDTNNEANYPVWYYCIKYGTTNCNNTSFISGWYLPTLAELFGIWEEKTSVNESLNTAGGNMFDSSYYWSSTQSETEGNRTYTLSFDNGALENATKNGYNTVCAVRQFTY